MSKVATTTDISKAIAEHLLQKMREQAVESRGAIEYPDGAYGITEILYCPRKAHLRRKYPEVRAEALEIDEGFRFEREIEEALTSLWGERIVREDTVEAKINGVKICGHVDFVIVGNRYIAGIEAKHTKFMYHNLADIDLNTDIIAGEEAKNFAIPSNYILQARIQKTLLEKKYNKPVVHHIVAKTMVRLKNNALKKIIVFYPIEESLEDYELEAIVEDFKNPIPRYSWECRYCIYKKEGLCEGSREFKEKSTEKQETELPAEIQEALDKYLEYYRKLKDIDAYLKKALDGQNIQLEGVRKKVGWITRTKFTWNVDRVFQILGKDAVRFFSVNWRKQNELYELLKEKNAIGEDVVIEEVVREWKGLV